MAAKSIMVQGTMSGVGKSLIAAGLCRIFRDEGYRVAPFKSQNMALNCHITSEGLEMGRAQAVQAAAAGREPSVLMNPVLLKPTSDRGSQVVVLGKAVGNMEAEAYFRYKRSLIPVIRSAYEELAADSDIIVIEGAGSPAEINLKKDDIVNMGMAGMAGARVLLVGDIDRGGVFAQLYGTTALLEEKERERIGGLVINKFRGDPGLLGDGPARLEALTGKPVVGIVPYMDIHIEEEDSLSDLLRDGIRPERGRDGTLPVSCADLAVIRFPRISNYTDFQAFSLEKDVRLRFVSSPDELGQPDAVILPGTKNTVGDLLWMRERGIEEAVRSAVRDGAFLFGICGGYQMLGMRITDPSGAESGGGIRGMGFLAEETIFSTEKKMCRFTGLSDFDIPELSGKPVSGYEVHMGRTAPSVEAAVPHAACAAGSYLHGIFDEPGFRDAFLRYVMERRGKTREAGSPLTAKDFLEGQISVLARTLEESLDMDRIHRLL